jgi:hypothetical protein
MERKGSADRARRMKASNLQTNTPAGSGRLASACSVLLPCPFCGGKAVTRRKAIYYDTIAVVVRCGSVCCPIHPETTPCDIKGILRGKVGAWEAWNHRPNVSDQAREQKTL